MILSKAFTTEDDVFGRHAEQRIDGNDVEVDDPMFLNQLLKPKKGQANNTSGHPFSKPLLHSFPLPAT